MDRNTQRFYSAPVQQVFATALRTAVELGYAVVSADPLDHAFAATSAHDAHPGAAEDFRVSVAGEGSLARVTLTGHRMRNVLAARGRLVANESAPVATPFLNALTRALDTRPAGWFADPSGRFAQRWWDGSTWTKWARDDSDGARFEDPPNEVLSAG